MLSEPKNGHLITKIKASITAGIRPTSMIFYEQPTDPWVPFDFKLIEAYQILKQELCPKCGHPIWLCRSSSNRVEFSVREAYCAAERSLKEREESSKSLKERTKPKDRKQWGRFHYTVPFVPKNIEGTLPTRKEYYEEMQKARGTME